MSRNLTNEISRYSPTEGNIGELFVRYATPSVLGMIGLSLYILADTFFIANGIGELGLSALNIALPAYSLINALGLLVGVGGATVLAIAKETGCRETQKAVFGFSLSSALVLSTPFLLAGMFFPGHVVKWLGVSNAVFFHAKEYARVILLFAPLFIVNQLVVAFVRNDGAPGLAMASLLAGVAFNTVFDYVFIYITGWGMFGAALATGGAPLVGLIVLSAYFLRRPQTFGLTAIKFRPSWLSNILKGGSASFITELAGGIVIFCFNLVILDLSGDLGVAAYGIVANVSIVCTAVFTGLGQGLQPLVSSNYGAGQTVRCRRTLHIGMLCALVLGILFWGAVTLFPRPIAMLFNRDGNAELTRIAIEGISLYFLSLLFSGLNIVVISYYQALLDSRKSVFLSLLRGLFGILAGLAVLPKLWGISGVWLTVVFAESSTLMFATYFLLMGKRAEKEKLPVGARKASDGREKLGSAAGD